MDDLDKYSLEAAQRIALFFYFSFLSFYFLTIIPFPFSHQTNNIYIYNYISIFDDDIGRVAFF